MASDYDSVSIVVKEFQHNIKGFFSKSIEWKLLKNRNMDIMKKIL